MICSPLHILLQHIFFPSKSKRKVCDVSTFVEVLSDELPAVFMGRIVHFNIMFETIILRAQSSNFALLQTTRLNAYISSQMTLKNAANPLRVELVLP